MSQAPPRIAYRLALAATLALIVYGCLYPFRFEVRSLAASPFSILVHSWPSGLTRSLAADTAANILLCYLTAGISVAALLAAIEAAQTHIVGRTADITDPILAVIMAGALYCLEVCPRIVERKTRVEG